MSAPAQVQVAVAAPAAVQLEHAASQFWHTPEPSMYWWVPHSVTVAVMEPDTRDAVPTSVTVHVTVESVEAGTVAAGTEKLSDTLLPAELVPVTAVPLPRLQE